MSTRSSLVPFGALFWPAISKWFRPRTCHTCFDQIPGCAGAAACRLLTGVADNAAVAVAATGASLFSLQFRPTIKKSGAGRGV
eukprot:4696187-Prymnesium_polylepis.1